MNIELYKNKFVFDHAAGFWYIWKGHYWTDDGVKESFSSIDSIIDVYISELERLTLKKVQSTKKDEDIEENLKKRINGLHTVKRRRDVLVMASFGHDRLAISGNEWDKKPWLLTCPNGVIDLKTGEVKNSDPSDYIKTITRTEWKGIDEKAPIWEKFLENIFDNFNNVEKLKVIDFLQRLLGYSITGICNEHIFPIFYGEGRNGKGTVIEVLAHILGSMAGPIRSEMLLDLKKIASNGGPTSDIMSLRGKRMVWASETGEGKKLGSEKVKWLVGGDSLVGRPPYGKLEVTFTPTHKLFLLTNHKPHVSADDYAIWQRIYLIPFHMKFVDNPKIGTNERKKDTHLFEKLLQESSGILAWLVKGCLSWQKEGLSPPDSVSAATNDYQKEEDLIGHFIDACCVIGNETQVKSSELYEAYRNWCEKNGHRSITGTAFGKKIVKRFQKKKFGCMFYLGLGLISNKE